MNKKILIFATLLTALFINAAEAQQKPSFGVKLNGNLTNVKLTDLNSNSNYHAGASVAGFSKIYLTELLSLQPELMLNYTETKIKAVGERLRFKYVSVEVPVYLQANINAGRGQIIIGAGPHIGYGVSADTRTERLTECDPLENVIELDHWYAGGGVSVGYEFHNRISINAGYQIGFDFSSRHKTSGIRTQTVSLGVGYRF